MAESHGWIIIDFIEFKENLVAGTARTGSIRPTEYLDLASELTGRSNYDDRASFVSAGLGGIGKVMVNVVPESSLLLTWISPP